MRNCQETEKSRTKLCTTLFTEQRKLALTRIERGVGGPGAQLRPASRSHRFTVDGETGVLPVLFNEAAS